MKKIIFILLLLLLASGAYFWLQHRKTTLISEQGSNSFLQFDNPTGSSFLFYLDNYSLEIPAQSIVHYPVNDLHLREKSMHLRSIEKASGKTIADTTCKLPDDPLNYFINPSLSRYREYSQHKIFLRTTPVDQSLKPTGSPFTMEEDLGRSDTTFAQALIITIEGKIGPFNVVVPENDDPSTHSKILVFIERTQHHGPMTDIFYEERWEGFFSPVRIVERAQ